PFDERVQNARTLAIDVDGNAAKRPLGEAVALDLRPFLAAVGRLPEPAARAAPVHAAGATPPLVHRRVEDLIVRRIHHEIVGAGVVVALEHLLPLPAAVGRLVDAAIAARPPQTSGCGDEDGVVVPRIDHDAVDELRGPKTHVREGLAAVGRLVDT